MLTPEQATRLTLAENLGVVSLIPRNPDDESLGDVAVYTPDDIFNTGDPGNNRKKEQGREDSAGEPKADSGSLATVVEHAEPKPEPPFTMEVIEREAVRLVAFDRLTGRPIRDAVSASHTGPSLGSSLTSGVTTGAAGGASAKESPETTEDFPIDFDPN